MNTTELLVLAAIGIVAAVFILRPLLRGRAGSPVRRAQVPSTAEARPVASDELAELELDRAMGRISEADFERWRGELAGAPAAEGPAMPDESSGRAESLVRRWREMPRPRCPRCGERPEPEARFCSNCGTSLEETA